MKLYYRRFWECMIILLIPILFFMIFSLIVHSITGRSVSEFIGGFSDMAGYYIQINTAIEHGIFSDTAGYNGYVWEGSVITTADWLFYGAHGPFILVPYILIGSIIGWSGAAPLAAHLILLIIAFYFVYFCSKSLKKTLTLQIIVFSFTPLILYFGTTMMEVQQYAWAIIFISLLYAFVKRQSWASMIGFLSAIVLSSAGRITNSVFLVPFFVFLADKMIREKVFTRTRIIQLFSGVGAAVMALSIFFVNARMSASYHAGIIFPTMQTMNDDGFIAAFRMVLDRARENTVKFFSPDDNQFFVYLRYAISAFFLLLIFNAFYSVNQKRFRFKAESLGLAIMLLSIAVLNITFNEVYGWMDFRVMAPFFVSLVCYLVLRYESYTILSHIGVTVIAVSLVFLSHLYYFFPITFDDFNRSPYTQRSSYTQYIHYNAEAGSRFDNTVLLSSGMLLFAGPDIDAGLGILIDMTGGDFSFEKIAQVGVRYIVVPEPRESVQGFYDILAQGDDYVVYQLQ